MKNVLMPTSEISNKFSFIAQLAQVIIVKCRVNKRIVVAIAGAPGSGKSTLAEQLSSTIQAQTTRFTSQIVAMDGFHLDNKLLQDRGLLEVKGAPNTFDIDQFKTLLQSIKEHRKPLLAPIFDRENERVIANVIPIDLATQIVIVEGNYLLLKSGAWADLKPLFDLTVFIHVPPRILEERLIKRWLAHGFSQQQARLKVANNDLINVKRVIQESRQADIDFY